MKTTLLLIIAILLSGGYFLAHAADDAVISASPADCVACVAAPATAP